MTFVYKNVACLCTYIKHSNHTLQTDRVIIYMAVSCYMDSVLQGVVNIRNSEEIRWTIRNLQNKNTTRLLQRMDSTDNSTKAKLFVETADQGFSSFGR